MFENFAETFSSSGFMPHIHCYLGKPALVWTMFVTDMLIGLAYVSISITLWGLVRKINISFSMVVFCFGIFIAACGGTHFMEVYTMWNPEYWSSAMMKIVTALASVGTGIYLYRLRHPLFQVAEAAKLSEQRRLDLEVLTNTLEKNVQERTKQLEAALQVRDDFLSVASHELRTPITVLKLKSELNRRLLKKENTEVSQRIIQFNEEMEKQVDRLTRLVEDMLDISRAKAGSFSMAPERINVSEALSMTVDRMAPTLIQADIKIETQIEPDLYLFADLMRMEQVFSNLIANTVQYAKGTSIRVAAFQVGEEVQIVFQDRGPGIPIDARERIFDRFERLSPKDHSGGLGVGLYLSRAIVVAHQGSLELDTSVLKGACFVIKIPSYDSETKLDRSVSVAENGS